MQETHDVFSRELQVPGLPAKVQYSAAQQPAYAPRIPQPDISSLNAVERTHVQSEQRTAQDQDQQLYQVPLFYRPCSVRMCRLSRGVLRTDTSSSTSLAMSTWLVRNIAVLKGQGQLQLGPMAVDIFTKLDAGSGM